MTALRLTRSPQSLHDKTRTLRRITQAPFSAPATSAYLLVLIATTSVLGSSSAQTDNQLLLSFSTNLHQLAHDPVRVLIASAFWTSGWWELALWIALFAAILAPVERRLGWRRTTITFAAGHIGATLIVASGLWIGIQRGADPANVLARDVGASYGFFAVATLAAYLLTPRYRTRYFAAIIGYVLATAALFHTFTNFGHLAAVAIGLACYPLARTQTGQEYGEDPRGRGNDPFLSTPFATTARDDTSRALGMHGTARDDTSWHVRRSAWSQNRGQCEIPTAWFDNKAVGVARGGTMSNDGRLGSPTRGSQFTAVSERSLMLGCFDGQ